MIKDFDFGLPEFSVHFIFTRFFVSLEVEITRNGSVTHCWQWFMVRVPKIHTFFTCKIERQSFVANRLNSMSEFTTVES